MNTLMYQFKINPKVDQPGVIKSKQDVKNTDVLIAISSIER